MRQWSLTLYTSPMIAEMTGEAPTIRECKAQAREKLRKYPGVAFTFRVAKPGSWIHAIRPLARPR